MKALLFARRGRFLRDEKISVAQDEIPIGDAFDCAGNLAEARTGQKAKRADIDSQNGADIRAQAMNYPQNGPVASHDYQQLRFSGQQRSRQGMTRPLPKWRFPSPAQTRCFFFVSSSIIPHTAAWASCFCE